MARLLLLFLHSRVEGHLLYEGVFVGDSQHLFWHPRALHDELEDQWWVLVSLLEEHDDRFVANLRDDVSLVAKVLDELSKWLSLLLDDVG
jgi:hypothetical protein